jgi:hypothetical protein
MLSEILNLYSLGSKREIHIHPSLLVQSIDYRNFLLVQEFNDAKSKQSSKTLKSKEDNAN